MLLSFVYNLGKILSYLSSRISSSIKIFYLCIFKVGTEEPKNLGLPHCELCDS